MNTVKQFIKNLYFQKLYVVYVKSWIAKYCKHSKAAK